jgi:hypothetical protein
MSAFSYPDAGPFIQNASFVRLQEARLRWSRARPSSASGASFLDRFAVTAIARNLALWTSYGGFDPEISTPSAATPGAELAQTPIPVSVLLRVELGAPVP